MNRQPIPLTRNGRLVAVVQPAPTGRQVGQDEPAAATQVPRYPTLESLAGAAGTLPEPRSWKEVLEQAKEEHLAKKLPPQHEGSVRRRQRHHPLAHWRGSSGVVASCRQHGRL